MNYTSVGIGDIIITATADGLSDSISIEDCFVTMFSGDETWTKYTPTATGALNINYSENELIWSTIGSCRWQSDKTFQTNDDWVVTFQMKASGNDGGRVGLHKSLYDNPEIQCVGFKPQSGALTVDTSPNQNTNKSEVRTIGYSSYIDVRLEATQSNNTINVYLNDILKKSQSNVDWLSDTIAFMIHGWTSPQTIYVKNVKAKRLTSST